GSTRMLDCLRRVGKQKRCLAYQMRQGGRCGWRENQGRRLVHVARRRVCGGGRNMKCKDCACYKDMWCTMVTDRPDPDMERDCAHITREQVEKMRGAWVYMTDDDGCTWTE